MKVIDIALTLVLSSASAVAQAVIITSPAKGAIVNSAVNISATITGGIGSNHLEIWDSNNNRPAIKLGNAFTNGINAVYVLPSGTHNTTMNEVTAAGKVIGSSKVSYVVTEFCTNSSTQQCDFDQLGIADPDTACYNAPNVPLWIGDSCVSQGDGSTQPYSYNAETTTTSLNGKGLLLKEANAGYSNVIFNAYSPVKTPTLHSHWKLDLYVYLPDPLAHQAVEFDVQYVWGGYWTKFYTECAFNVDNGTGYWAVFGGGNGWTFLDGRNGTPYVPCNRSQFSTPWSAGPATSGCHHIVWTFTRNPGGYAEYNTLTFDGTTYTLNYVPSKATNGGSNQGDFSALVQLDGAKDATAYPTVQTYVNELNITHTP